MKLPDVHTDFWHLLSAEVRNAANPDTFLIPTKAERDNLVRGNAAKLLIEIEGVAMDGSDQRDVERMWVIVSEKIGDTYIGILDSDPASIKPSDDVYLCYGAEVPFRAEHIIEIASPPASYANWQLNQKPERVWPRD